LIVTVRPISVSSFSATSGRPAAAGFGSFRVDVGASLAREVRLAMLFS
jgi:hypothetical protein